MTGSRKWRPSCFLSVRSLARSYGDLKCLLLSTAENTQWNARALCLPACCCSGRWPVGLCHDFCFLLTWNQNLKISRVWWATTDPLFFFTHRRLYASKCSPVSLQISPTAFVSSAEGETALTVKRGLCCCNYMHEIMFESAFMTVCLRFIWRSVSIINKQRRCIVLNVAVSFSYADTANNVEIKVQTVSDGIKVSCTGRKMKSKENPPQDFIMLPYNDENTGEYSCVGAQDGDENPPKIYVKFRCKFFNHLHLQFPHLQGQYFLTITTLWKCFLRVCVCVSSLWQLHRDRQRNGSRTSYRKRGGYDRDRSGRLYRRFSDPDQTKHLS